MAAKYGKLSESWREDISKGFAECFRVLYSDGVLVFKWNETQIKVGIRIWLCLRHHSRPDSNSSISVLMSAP
jgi:hypothetical protein